MAGKYSVLILRGLQADVSMPEIVKRFNARNLEDGYDQFAHQKNMIKWSKQHRERLGLSPYEDVTIQLFDHREGYELQEATV
jgi:hypothetical protein